MDGNHVRIQSAVTARIKSIEAELNKDLFVLAANLCGTAPIQIFITMQGICSIWIWKKPSTIGSYRPSVIGSKETIGSHGLLKIPVRS